MKSNLKSALMLGMLLATGVASADTIFFSGSVGSPGVAGDWENVPQTQGTGNQAGEYVVTDTLDGDITFGMLNSSNLPTGTLVTISEHQSATQDLYVVNFDFSQATLVAGQYYDVTYDMQLTGSEFVKSVSVDTTTPTPGSYADKVLYDVGGNIISPVITSTNGVPSGSFVLLGQNQYVAVHEEFGIDSTGVMSSATNTFAVGDVTTSVPEPVTLSLLGLGLAAFGARRRFAA